MPALIDSMENQVEKDYTGWPDRLYLIDSNGRVAFKSMAGPFGFEPGNLAKALQSRLLISETASRGHPLLPITP
jgi:hypothetical protein